MSDRLLDQRIDAVERRMETLRRTVVRNGEPGPTEQIDDLAGAVEDLAVMAEELSQANDELSRVQQALAAEHARFYATFEQSPIARLVTDQAGMVREANRAAALLFARSVPLLRGLPLVVLFASADRPTVLRALDEAAFADRAEQVVMLRRERRRAGAGTSPGAGAQPRRVAVLGVAPDPAPGDPAPMVQWSVRDVTEEEETKAALERALAHERETAEGLRKLSELRDLLLAAVAHDLRSPLAALHALADILQRGDPGDTARREDVVEKIRRTATEMLTLVGDLLDLARSEHGVMPLERTEADVSVTVRRAVDQVISAAGDGGPTFELELPPLTAKVDHRLVERIATNLVANARQHLAADRHVWVRVCDEPDGALLVVEDDGPGVAPEARDQAFDLFQRGAHSASLGIGLALVWRFAALHGGWAKVEDRPGGGASFQVLLPPG